MNKNIKKDINKRLEADYDNIYNQYKSEVRRAEDVANSARRAYNPKFENPSRLEEIDKKLNNRIKESKTYRDTAYKKADANANKLMKRGLKNSALAGLSIAAGTYGAMKLLNKNKKQ